MSSHDGAARVAASPLLSSPLQHHQLHYQNAISKIRRHVATTTESEIDGDAAIPLNWLDLRGSGLSVLERLCLEEALLRHDDQMWIVVGTHDVGPHRFLQNDNISAADCIIVMGMGGKPRDVLQIDAVVRDEIPVLKRFSGGGTVVLDASCLWTSVIGRPIMMTELEAFPRPLMEWSARRVFKPVFERLHEEFASKPPPLVVESLVLDSHSCGLADRTVRRKQKPAAAPGANSLADDIQFALRENDYVLGHRKMGGNAQSIVKEGWLHHSSFLWHCLDSISDYLTLPKKRPDYRHDRPHDEFLVGLSQLYPTLTHGDFCRILYQVLESASELDDYGYPRRFAIEKRTVPQALQVLDSLGGMQTWWQTKSRTRYVKDLETYMNNNPSSK